MNSQAEIEDAIGAFPPSLNLTPLSRNPLQLPASTIDTVMRRPVSALRSRAALRAQPSGPVRTSIIAVTFNNLVFNRICFESLVLNTKSSDCEVLVVDNGSTDGTAEYAQSLVDMFGFRLIVNDRNLGFAPAVNLGLAKARGEVIVLLNNDTLVPPGWLEPLLEHLSNPEIGFAGPVTNRTGNEAQIETAYTTYGDLVDFSRRYCQTHAGMTFDIPMITMFCAAMRRDVYDQVGPLDERFEIGLFEDEDYSMRVRACGYRVVCAEDCFVHHFGQASLGKLAFEGKYGEVFHANRQRWEEKWGSAWKPHRRRTSEDYQDLVQEIRRVVARSVPQNSILAVVSKGDGELIDLEGRRAWHFPQAQDGEYSGYYPADSVEAIRLVEAARSNGADFLLFPDTAMWWLEHYKEFADYLYSHFQLQPFEHICTIFSLRNVTGTGRS